MQTYNGDFCRYSLAAAKKAAASYGGGVYKEWYYTMYGYAVRNPAYPQLRTSDGPDYFRLDQYENCPNPTPHDDFPDEPSDVINS